MCGQHLCHVTLLEQFLGELPVPPECTVRTLGPTQQMSILGCFLRLLFSPPLSAFPARSDMAPWLSPPFLLPLPGPIASVQANTVLSSILPTLAQTWTLVSRDWLPGPSHVFACGSGLFEDSVFVHLAATEIARNAEQGGAGEEANAVSARESSACQNQPQGEGLSSLPKAQQSDAQLLGYCPSLRMSPASL